MARTIAHQAASLIHQATQREREALERARAEYIDALFKETGTAADADKLRDDAIRLGKNSGDINADHAAIVEAQQLAASIQSLAGCAAVAELLACAAQRSAENVRQQFQLLNAQRDALMRLADKASELVATDARQRQQLADAKAAAPELLARIAIPDAGLVGKTVAIDTLVPAISEWKSNYLAVKPSTEIAELAEPTAALVGG